MTITFYKNRYINNIKKIKKMTNSKLCIVVKSNGYGIGINNLIEMGILNYVDYLAITENYEADIIRRYSKDVKIIRIRSALENEILEGMKYDIEEIIDSLDKLKLVSEKFKNLKVHLSIDQHMNNMGIKIDDILINRKIYSNIIKLNLIGIMGHFPSLVELNDLELNKFIKLSNKLKKTNFKNLIIHICNSDNFLKYKNILSFDMIRIGYCILGGSHNFFDIVLNWKANPVSIRTLKKDEPLGYNSNFIADKDMKIAIIPIGYNNGFPKIKNNKQYLIFRDKKLKVVGDVNMNQIHVDITNVDLSEENKLDVVGDKFKLNNLRTDKYFNDSYLIINILRNNLINFI